MYNKEAEKKAINNIKNTEIKFTEEEIKCELVRKEQWKNRTLITKISFLMIIIIISYSIYNPNITDNQLDLFKYFGLFLSTIVLGYLGLNSYEKTRGK